MFSYFFTWPEGGNYQPSTTLARVSNQWNWTVSTSLISERERSGEDSFQAHLETWQCGMSQRADKATSMASGDAKCAWHLQSDFHRTIIACDSFYVYNIYILRK